jgi:MbtH protein
MPPALETPAISVERNRDMETEDRIGTWTVLVNDEEQHSLWPSQKPAPAGWRNVGVYGSKEECLSYIEREWKDITPLSVRKALAS